MHLVVALGAPVLGIQPAQAGRIAQDLLVQRPGPLGVDEGLVVEADLHAEAGREAADHVQEVALKRGPGVDVADRHALLDGREAGAHGGDAVHPLNVRGDG